MFAGSGELGRRVLPQELHGWDLLGDHHLIRAWGSIDLVVGVVDERLVSFPK